MVGPRNAGLYRTYVEAYLALLLDSPCDSDKPISVIRRFFYRLTRTPAKELILRFASLADEMLHSMSITSDYTITGEFLDEMADTPIFREYLHFYRTGDAASLKFILSFLYFGKKMDFIDDALETSAFRDWMSIEEAMEGFEPNVDVTDCLRIIISQLIGKLDDTLFLPKHGPGYTSEGHIDPNDKLEHLSLDSKSSYAFRQGSFGRTSVDRVALSPFKGRSLEKQVAKLKFVPKNIKTMRSICMEPISRMYLQQEVARWLIDELNAHELGSVITLRDQTNNQRYAVAGSATYTCDTIDLSAASDRLHVDLIRKIFPRQALFYLLATRTSEVNVGDKVVKIHKFAPMGSALCFPVQSITFAAITLLGYLMQYYGCTQLDSSSKDWYWLRHIRKFIRSLHQNPEEHSLLLRPVVYGDDIICDFRTTDNVLKLLDTCGLKVNLDKSFIGGTPFRESCGVFAYDGEDVSPILFRVPSFRVMLDPGSYASLIDLCNRAGDVHYYHLRGSMINLLKRTRIRGTRWSVQDYLPFVQRREEFGIFTTNPKPAKVCRFNVGYQRDEKRVAVVVPTGGRKSCDLLDGYLYDQWMRARLHGGSTDGFVSSAPRRRPDATRVRLRWTPV
jgi:hypothetical protein